MKTTILNVLVGITAVAAVPSDYASLETRQGGVVANDLKNGDCKPVTFIMARGSTETDNMGTVVGPQTCAAIKDNLGADQVACQGIGTEDGYAAALAPNFQPQNTDTQSINAALDIVNLAATQCPDSTIVMGGYSQGSAVVDNAIQQMPAATQAKVAGVVVWGFTRAEQDNLQIPGYPVAQTKVFCAQGDLMAKQAGTGNAAAGAAAGGAAGAAAGGAAGGAAGAAAGGAAGAATGAAAGGKKKNGGGLSALFGN
ncbi:hypothetical protein INS49_003127 [Diaporthe citri]|uniref:uncharacterized protein n=1 Tax=Diaporthe citri TaxID=83186 RepID=UPI001C806C79|nr:uncharacterized protein INS49_003127 [Diaporthe citri]KAG6368909.1 hypothetical protein INS49_003127 [Diaporthe citri]